MRAEAAFVEFAQAASPRLRRPADLMCGDWELASDHVQEGLNRVYVAWPRLTRASGELACARKAVVSALVDHARRRSSPEVIDATGERIVLGQYCGAKPRECATTASRSSSSTATRASRSRTATSTAGCRGRATWWPWSRTSAAAAAGRSSTTSRPTASCTRGTASRRTAWAGRRRDAGSAGAPRRTAGRARPEARGAHRVGGLSVVAQYQLLACLNSQAEHGVP